jgi:hypothetical protein
MPSYQRPGSHGICLGLLLFAALACLPISGCGQPPGYPKVTPVAVLNHPGSCAYCGRKLDSVHEANLITIQGIQYVVCDETCAKGQATKVEKE